MHFLPQSFSFSLLAALPFSLAAPTSTPDILSARQAECAPTSYTIMDYKYTSSPSTGAQVSFSFWPRYSNPSIISDSAWGGAKCSAVSAPGTPIPNSNECSAATGRNLLFDLRAPVERGEWQFVHSWRCNGQEWLSSTPHKMNPLNCEIDAAGTTTCTSGPSVFGPMNVRRICGAPTCP